MSLTPNDLSHLSDAEFHALCPQGEHAPGAEPPAVAERPSEDEWAALVERAWDTHKGAGYRGEQVMYDCDFDDAVEFMRRELARWGQPPAPPAPPAEGEIDQLVSQLRDYAQGEADNGWHDDAARFRRAAELLAQAHSTPPAPVPEPVPVPTFRDAIQLAQGCHDYSGGYGGTPCAEAFHAGIGTVVNVLTKAASGPWDHQTQAVFAVGADLPLPAP